MATHPAIFKLVIQDQRADLLDFLSKTRLIQRDQQLSFEEILKSKLIAVILGVRRAGKSTLCLQNLDLDKTSYLNFDDERLINITAEDLNSIYEALLHILPGCKTYIFDEIQNIRGWELFVNRLQRKGLKVIITGSNGHLLSQDLATHLTGRHLSLELFPFSFHEYLRFFGITPRIPSTTEERATIKVKLEQYVKSGGFPEVIQGENSGPYLRDLFDRIISKDVIQRYAIKYSKALKELGLYLIQQSGCQISYQKLARTFEFRSVHTVKNYLGYLEECYLIQEIQAYSNKLKERFTLPRKVYAIDPGMIQALSSKPTPDRGALLETLVFLHLRRTRKDIYYYRDEKHEVDFVLCHNGKPYALIQSCWALQDAKTRAREVDSLILAGRTLKVDDLQIITGIDGEGPEELKIGARIVQIRPLWEFLLSFQE